LGTTRRCVDTVASAHVSHRVENLAMKNLFALAALLTLLATPSPSFAGCSEHNYRTECKDDSSCEWDSKKDKCRNKEATTGCASHKSEFYCEANHCKWDILRKGNKCTESTSEQPSRN
jgi:hypothetical protein